MSSNLLPQADENNPETASPQATPTRKWRGTVAAGEEEEASAPGTGERGGGFGAAARPGGWRERERIKKAEGELSSGAGWNTVGKDGETKVSNRIRLPLRLNFLDLTSCVLIR